MRTNPVLDGLGTYPIAVIQERARAMRAAGEPLIDFSIGDPREPTPEFIREALRTAVPEVSQYPTTAGLAELRQAVAGYVSRRFGVEVDPQSQVLPVAGSKEAIFSTPLAFVDRGRGDTVVWATPGYPIYERGALLAGAEGHHVLLTGDFVLRASDIPEEILDRAALVWTCSPHNPTGSVTSRDDLAGLHAAALVSGALLCADECYADLYEDDPPPSVLQVAAPSLEGVLSYLSLSKRSGMTGYRSGVVVGDAVAIALLRALRTSTGTASPEFVQRAAIAAWGDDDHVTIRRETFARKRSVLRKAFEALGIEVAASRAGLYCWVRVEDDLAAAERLLAHGVVVSPGRAFGPGGEGFLRLALVPTVEECEQAVEVLERALG
ncbi:MAG TPA: aminotransferase class I/II-fold pyridoxal phosphate-dependent enzyme [Acidimicrobiia bacterium]|nr:aminotransferase class I/II-fold pyridoxal phosphate-dependent enzyme [Acidimicrobiia bacterium]